jgi:putative ABC transport system permease protein
MLRIALKGVWARKTRLLLTSLAVVLGTAFLTGTTVFTDTIKSTFSNLFSDVFSHVDTYVRSSTVIKADFGQDQRGKVSASLVPTIAAVPGVKVAEPFIQEFAAIIANDGSVVGSKGPGAPNFGGTLNGGEVGFWTITSGHAPTDGSQVAVDGSTFAKGHFALGDQVRITAVGGTRRFTIVGVARFGKVRSPGGATFALFDDQTAASFLNAKADSYDAIIVVGDGSVSQTVLTQRITAAIAGHGAQAITGKQITSETQSTLEKRLSFFSVFLSVFAFIALFVATFVIYNLFSITVAQRRRENALLRAVGASRRQVTQALVVESVAIGLAGSVLGLFAGVGLAVGLRGLFKAIGIDIPSTGLALHSATVIRTIVIGLVVTVASAILPARRSSRVPPVAAMRDEAVEAVGWSRSRLFWGVGVFGLGVAATIGALFGKKLSLLAPGAIGIFLGIFILGPLVAGPLARLAGRPLRALRGVTGQMGAENAARNPKRTARTAGALVVGSALVTAVTVMAFSITASAHEVFAKEFLGDVTVSAREGRFGGLPLSVQTDVSALPEVAAATGIGEAFALLPNSTNGTALATVDPASVGKVFDFSVVSGSLADLGPGTIAISQKKADSLHATIGSPIHFALIAGQPRTLTVAAIYSQDTLVGSYVVAKSLFTGSDQNLFDATVYVLKKPGVSLAALTASVTKVVSEVAPSGKTQNRAQYVSSQTSRIGPLLNLIYGLLGLSIVIAAIGIVITLLLSVYERRRELGLLRAIGMSRSQVRSSVRWEALIVTLLGALEGMVIGLLLGFAVVHALHDQGLTVFDVPVGRMIGIFVFAIVVGMLAAIIPARRATKVSILDAVTTM